MANIAHLLHAPCSREGAGIGEGIAYLLEIAVVTTSVVLVVAIVSGVVIGLRRGAVGKQVLEHLGWAVLTLVVLPPLSYAAWLVRDAIVDARVKRVDADYARWLQPFAELKPGALGSALDQVLADGGPDPGRAIYLVLWLQKDFDTIVFEPTDADRAVLAALPERMTHELELRHGYTDPSNIQSLKGAANWLRLRPDLPKAAAECHSNDYCLGRLADAWWNSCRRDLLRCRTETPDETMDAMATRYSEHHHFHSVLLGTRQMLSRSLPTNTPGT